MYTFSATLRSGNRRGSWWTTAIPSARAWAGPAMTVGSPSTRIVPAVGLVDAGQDLDQGALARAVLADQRVDLAGPQVERHVVSACVAREPLGHAGQRDLGAPRLGRRADRGVHGRGHAAVTGRRITRDLPMPRARRPWTMSSGAPSSVSTASMSSVRQNVANATRCHLVWSTIAITRGGRHHRPLDLRLLVGGIGQPGFDGEAGGADEGRLDVDPARTGRRRGGRPRTSPPSARGRRSSAR